ncbi:hypothetical protein [Flavobacterium sp.]|uniref:hypothetical protein n=1 Tax=Flavobacterium sp. TaxID=239 RepID=UPI0025EEA983|nr:hypothetical protein [Flavobacterium sp.]
MNDAHLHLVFNHFPIIGTIFGFGVLAAGLILKNNTVKNVAYCLFIVTAIFAYASISTGAGAAGVVKGMGDITKPMIHKHAEIAEKLAFILYSLAVLSIIGLYVDIKKLGIAKWIAFLALFIAAVAGYISKEVGTSGGEIRHTEIRSGGQRC